VHIPVNFISAVVMARQDRALVQRGNQYWFWMAIPSRMRHLFPPTSKGNAPDKIAERIGPNLDVARPIAAARLATCKTIFAGIDAKAITTREQVEKALRRTPLQIKLEEETYRQVIMAFQEEELRKIHEHAAAIFEAVRRGVPLTKGEQPAQSRRGETISAALEAWLKELQRRKSTLREETIKGHRRFVQKFIEYCRGDIPLADVTRKMASDFLQLDGLSNRTRNNYSTTLRAIFKCAHQRDAFNSANPFEGQQFEVEEEKAVPFTVAELQKLFDAMPREVAPKHHTPQAALPWCALMSLYSGMRLGEVAGMEVADVREAKTKDGKCWVFDLHHSDRRKLKNDYSIRLVPVHKDLIKKHKLLDYIKRLPQDGPLFPGVKAEKGVGYGKRIGDAFHDLREKLGVTREGLKFHSFRHNVSSTLDAAEVRQSDVARVLGQSVDGIAFGTYSKEGPGLKVVASVVEKIKYDGLRL
jgi:integrase